VAVQLKDGKELWRFPWVTHWDINADDPVLVDGDKLLISSFDRGCALLRLTADQPKVLWENKNMGNHFDGCIFVGSFLFGIDGNTDQPDRELRCIDPRTGNVRWRHAGLGLGSIMASAGKLIVLGEKGELVVAEASPEAFKPIAAAQVLSGKCWTVPVLANGRLYCRNAKGTLICLDLKNHSQSGR